MRSRRSALALFALALSVVTGALAQDKSITVASTTSTQDSGLFDFDPHAEQRAGH